MRGWLLVIALGLGCFFAGCKKSEPSDSQPAFAVGKWWAEPRSNLLLAVRDQQSLTVCFGSSGSVDSARLEKETGQFISKVKFALLEWFRAIKTNPQLNFANSPCQADLTKGMLMIVLHYDEASFQKQIIQSTSKSLGLYSGDGILYLNMAGVLNPNRDPTGGRKTLLHELGHAFGLHHSEHRGAVMWYRLSEASEHLTSDDIVGIQDVWKRIQKAGSSTTSAVTPQSGSEWAVSPPQESSVSVTLRHDSWFKISTAQSTTLTAQEKCALQLGQVLRVKILNDGRLERAHLKVQLDELLSGCAFGQTGQVGYLYQPHVD